MVPVNQGLTDNTVILYTKRIVVTSHPAIRQVKPSMTHSLPSRSLLSVGFIAMGILGIVVGASRLPSHQEVAAIPMATTMPTSWSWLENLESGYALEYPTGSAISQEKSGTLVTLPNGEKLWITAPTPTQVAITPDDLTNSSPMLSEVISHMRASVEALEVATESAQVELERFAGASTKER